MKMTILSYYQLDYQGIDQVTGTLDLLEPKPITIINKTIVPDQFKDDVAALSEYTGIPELTVGMTIKMSLQEALRVLPRKRKRVDSYNPLVKFLKDEMGVTLLIKSQKSKQYGKEIL